jgi:hypothetical protein
MSERGISTSLTQPEFVDKGPNQIIEELLQDTARIGHETVAESVIDVVVKARTGSISAVVNDTVVPH